MSNSGSEAKTERLSIRVTPTERELLDEFAFVLDEPVSDIVRQWGVDDAVERARQVRERRAVA